VSLLSLCLWKRVLLGDTAKEKLPRYYKNIGLGFKTPKEAIEGTYIDKKCPFTGNVSIRGRILSGVVTKMKMQRTIVIRRDYLHYIRKYNRFEKRHKNMSVHLSPCFRAWLGGPGPGADGWGAKTPRSPSLHLELISGTSQGFLDG
uniref:Small ribosomal subunit protein uS17 n=1 Tax=Vombatus ursinus TaxID=29139 RepID=A0A4X2LKK6_VOMUR